MNDESGLYTRSVKRILLGAGSMTLVVALVVTSSGALLRTHEFISVNLFPSAERAYAYGVRHFDARRSRDYDIHHAEIMFKKSLRLNPQQPFAQHQLGRIEFLRGDITRALARINAEIATNPSPSPSSYYVRALIEGYMGDYEDAAKDYEVYLKTDPNNWAAINDYAWVLLKNSRALDALVALDWGLLYWPGNAWLLNSKITALFELGEMDKARETVALAGKAVMSITESDWMRAYPGNDPLIAREGVLAFQEAVRANIHTIAIARQDGSKGVR